MPKSLLSLDRRIKRVNKAIKNWQDGKRPSSHACFELNTHATLDRMAAEGKDGYIVFLGSSETGDVFHVYGVVGTQKIDPFIEKFGTNIHRKYRKLPILKRLRLKSDVAKRSMSASLRCLAKRVELGDAEERLRNALRKQFPFYKWKDLKFISHKDIGGFEIDCTSRREIKRWLERNMEKFDIINVTSLPNKNLFVWV